MPKQKSNRGAAKRLKVSASGKAIRGLSGIRHGMRRKARDHKRRLKGTVPVAAADQPRMLRLLGKR